MVIGLGRADAGLKRIASEVDLLAMDRSIGKYAAHNGDGSHGIRERPLPPPLPRGFLAVVLVVLAAFVPALPALAQPVAHPQSTGRTCLPLPAPTSSQTQISYRRQVARRQLRINRARSELARERQLIFRARRTHDRRLLTHDAIRRAKLAMTRLKSELTCLSSEITTKPTEDVAEPDAVPPASGLSSVPAPIDSPEANEPLSIAVSNNHLVNGHGQTVTLHGVNISGTLWQCTVNGQAFISPTDDTGIAAITSWHVNAVRIPLDEDCWLGINGAATVVETYRETIRAYVNRLHAHGLYVILDLHLEAPGETLSGLVPHPEGFFEMADEEHAPSFWASIASYFKSDHAVLFDLFNEPFGISWNCWREGCVAPRGFPVVGMQQLVNVVRKTGATQPIMVGGLEKASLAGQGWLNNHPKDPLGQLVASVHAYDQASVSRFNRNIGVVAEQFPVVMGEVGEMDCTHKDLDVLLPWADEHGISYLAWDWYTGGCTTSPALISNYDGTPTNYGIGYREHLLATFPAQAQ
jgi:endoglucanase